MTDEEQITNKHTSKVAKSDWAVMPSPQSEEDTNGEKGFVSRLIPKSKRGKVVFASATAQIISMVAVPLFWGITKKALPEALNGVAHHLANVFDKNPKMMNGILKSRTWDGLFEPEEREAWNASTGLERKNLQAQKFISMGIQGAYNIASTIWVRNILDKKLEINAGSKAVAKTQFLDSAIAIGALLAIPTYMPKTSDKWRGNLRPIIKKASNIATLGQVGEKSLDEFSQDASFFTVNIGLPDALGFTAGLIAMLGELDEKAARQEQAERAEKEGHTRA